MGDGTDGRGKKKKKVLATSAGVEKRKYLGPGKKMGPGLTREGSARGEERREETEGREGKRRKSPSMNRRVWTDGIPGKTDPRGNANGREGTAEDFLPGKKKKKGLTASALRYIGSRLVKMSTGEEGRKRKSVKQSCRNGP